MGNCLPRKNKVDAIDNIIAREKSNSNRKSTKSIKDGKRKMFQQLQTQQQSVGGGGVSFMVELDNKIIARPPRRLEKLERNSSLDLTVQQLNEKQIRADLLRQERRASLLLKAREDKQRCLSAMKRREAKSEAMKAKLEAKKMDHERKIEERRKKLEDLAQKTKAAKQRKAKHAE